MMASATQQLREWLHGFDFRGLLVEGLGWNHDHAEPLRLEVDSHDYALDRVAEKAGFVVYVCSPDASDAIPEYPVRRKIERQVGRLTFEHMIIFVDAARTEQCWQWVKRESGKPPTYREHLFRAGQTGEPLLQRLQTLAFDLDEEPALSVPVVASRVRQAMDVEKVTKRFYERFRTELTAFQEFIDGIAEQGDREWYASLMLNRMMFVYFIQKQGFLDSDVDYLRNRLERLRREGEPGRFQQFYRIFLLRLFHEGLGQPKADRAPDLVGLLGKVPFLNGGLFEVHDLERDNPQISIPDEAFERVFGFFDNYQWHLDERPRRADNEINPDVLGYIFEKYINQNQMGAYYTKEDITGYISRNTVIPFLFDVARKECPVAFVPGGGVWRLLQDDPDRYTYPAVAHGVTWNARSHANPARLEAPYELPEDIAVGVDDVCQRGGWNAAPPGEYALPTETWREVIARRQRHAEIRANLAAGEVVEINDLINLNLDIERFALDVIAQSEGPELLRAFWHAIRDVSVLDPTCGSGAFLFAALNILEPLYTACLEGMRGFVDDLDRTERPHSPNTLGDFRDVLAQAAYHPNERYFILKSIVLNNLYGVDIMEEAAEICKLRLFLKLVAQLKSYDHLEPLPDIDFNIRAGNTLVGFTSLEAVRRTMTVAPSGQYRALDREQTRALERVDEEAEIASAAFHQFRQQQTLLGGKVTAADKEALRVRLRRLDDELDWHLAAEHGVKPADTDAFTAWRAGHQPFHWFVRFYGIMRGGGFDVVIGNPPYVRRSKITDYSIRGYETSECPDIYAACIERSLQVLAAGSGRWGMILPISFQFSGEFQIARVVVSRALESVWVSTFSRNPAALFDAGLGVRSTIALGNARLVPDSSVYTTRLLRWTEDLRPSLFHTLEYTLLPDALRELGWPRLGSERIGKLFGSLVERSNPLSPKSRKTRALGAERIFFKSTALYFISAFFVPPPSFDLEGNPLTQSEVGSLVVPNGVDRDVLLALCLGKLALLWWASTGDDFHITSSGLGLTPILPKTLSEEERRSLIADALRIQEVLEKNVIYTRYAGKWMGNYDVKSVRDLTDSVDKTVLNALDLGDYWESVELEYARFFKMTGERPGTIRELPTFAK